MSEVRKIFKVVLLGDPNVGKTSIRKRYMGAGFSKSYLPTMGADFAIKTIDRDQTEIEMQIWDIAGQVGFQRLIPRFMANAKSAFFVFDLTVKDSFKHLTQWIQKYKEANENAFTNSPIYILGNKNDLSHQVVTDEEIESYRKYIINKLNLDKDIVKIFRTSAKVGENINEAFDSMVDDLEMLGK